MSAPVCDGKKNKAARLLLLKGEKKWQTSVQFAVQKSM